MPRFASVALTLLCLLLLGAPGTAQEDERRHKIGLVLGSEVDRKLGDEILSMVTDVFAASKRFVMIERHKLDALFKEQDLQRFLGNGNPALSQMLGLDLLGLVVHSVETKGTQEGKEIARVILDVRLVEVTTGTILETLGSERPYSPPALTLREAGIYLSETLREKFPLSGYVVKVKGKKVIVDLGTDDGLKGGASLSVVRKGEQIIHPVTHVPLAAEWIMTGELKVVLVAPEVSTCLLRWGKGIEPGSLVFLKEDPSLIEPKDTVIDPVPLSECKEKEKKSHVLDWLRRLVTRRSRLRCRVAGGAALL